MMPDACQCYFLLRKSRIPITMFTLRWLFPNSSTIYLSRKRLSHKGELPRWLKFIIIVNGTWSLQKGKQNFIIWESGYHRLGGSSCGFSSLYESRSRVWVGRWWADKRYYLVAFAALFSNFRHSFISFLRPKLRRVWSLLDP